LGRGGAGAAPRGGRVLQGARPFQQRQVAIRGRPLADVPSLPEADQQGEKLHPTARGGQVNSGAMERRRGLHTAQAQGGRDGLDLDDHRRTRSH